MNAHRMEATITKERTLLLNDLPFDAGQTVEVIVLSADELRLSDSDAAVEAERDAAAWRIISYKALQEIWDNPEDAAYDNA